MTERLRDRDHKAAKRLSERAKIIEHKIRYELLGGRKPNIGQQVLIDQLVVMISMCLDAENAFKAGKKVNRRDYLSLTSQVRACLERLAPKSKMGNPGKADNAHELDLAAILNDE